MNVTIPRYGIAIVLMLAIAFLSACTMHRKAAESETKISVAETPPKVLDAVMTRFPGASVVSVGRETETVGVIYDFELLHGGRKFEMDVKEDGTIIEIEKAIPAREMPQPIARAVQAKYPNATIKEVMEKSLMKGNQEQVHEYEVVLTTDGGRETEVTASLDGALKQE